MADAQRDNNRVTTIIGLDASGVIRQAKVDGVTGYLRLQLAATNSPASQLFSIAKRDQNRVPAKICVEADGTIQGILTDTDRNLYVAIA